MDGKAFGAEVVDIVKSYVDRGLAAQAAAHAAEVATLKGEIDALRKALADQPKPAAPELPDIPKMVADEVSAVIVHLPKPKDGDPGKSVTLEDVAPMIDTAVAREVGKAVAALPPALPGKDADMAEVERMVAERVEAVVPGLVEAAEARGAAAYTEACEKAEGAAARLVEAEAKAREAREASLREFTDLTAGLAKVERRCEAVEQAVEPVAKSLVTEAIAALPAPNDFDPAVLPPLVAAEVEKAVSALSKPQDGHTPTAAELDALIEPRVSKAVSVAVAGIPTPKDGCGIKELLIDREGALVATMDDGRLKSLGVVVGKNGADVDMAAVERRLNEAIAALPAPKDGTDGLGFDDMTVTNEGRNFTLRFARGDLVKEFTFALPVMIHQGVWAERNYQVGDVVTWGGSMWHCDVDGATAKPGEGEKQWHLVVKKGSPGKDLRPDEPKHVPVVKLRKDD